MMGGDARVIVGLGNPGKAYEGTRHNLGALVVEHLARERRLSFKSVRGCPAVAAEGRDVDGRFFLLRPTTFMNHSGAAVGGFLRPRGLSPSRALIVCDDWSLPFGRLRIRARGSAGGHNGLKSVISVLRTQDFPRLRLGIGTPGVEDLEGDERVAFVLGRFSPEERRRLPDFLVLAAGCCEAWLERPIDEVMSEFNKRKGDE